MILNLWPRAHQTGRLPVRRAWSAGRDWLLGTQGGAWVSAYVLLRVISAAVFVWFASSMPEWLESSAGWRILAVALALAPTLVEAGVLVWLIQRYVIRSLKPENLQDWLAPPVQWPHLWPGLLAGVAPWILAVAAVEGLWVTLIGAQGWWTEWRLIDVGENGAAASGIRGLVAVSILNGGAAALAKAMFDFALAAFVARVSLPEGNWRRIIPAMAIGLLLLPIPVYLLEFVIGGVWHWISPSGYALIFLKYFHPLELVLLGAWSFAIYIHSLEKLRSRKLEQSVLDIYHSSNTQ